MPILFNRSGQKRKTPKRRPETMKMKSKETDQCKFHWQTRCRHGGPTKEFFHSSLSCLSNVDPAFNIQLFVGLPGHLVPLCSVVDISSGRFEMAGKLIIHSILHGGPGFCDLAPADLKYL